MSLLPDSIVLAVAEQRRRDRLHQAEKARMVNAARRGRSTGGTKVTTVTTTGPRRWVTWLIHTATS